MLLQRRHLTADGRLRRVQLSGDGSETAESAPAATAKPVEAPQSEPIADAAPSEPELALPEPSRSHETRTPEEPSSRETETNQSAASGAAQAAAPPPVEAPESKTPTAPEAGLSPQSQRAKMTWHKSIAVHLERFKRYPEAARAEGATGMVVVKFTVDRAGHVTGQSVDRSAGSHVLDTAALALLRRAGALPAPPRDLPGDTFILSVPVLFQLPRAKTTSDQGGGGRAHQ
jgi:protein TonB